MRIIVAVIAAASFLFIGFQALRHQIIQTAPENGDPVTYNESYNVSAGIVEGIGTVAGPGVLWFGIGAFVLVGLGLAVVASSGGGR